MNVKRNTIIALSSFAMGALLVVATAACAPGTTQDATESVETAVIIPSDTITPAPTEQAAVEGIPVEYTPPVLNCEPGTVPGWLNEYGDATSCVDNHPCIATDTQDWFCNPIPVVDPAPVVTTNPCVITSTTMTDCDPSDPGYNIALDMPTYSLVPCMSEGEAITVNCYWDAAEQGNKMGASFIQFNGNLYYINNSPFF